MSILHIHDSYHWHCGKSGTATTNESQVTCPDCLERKPIDFKNHPLFPFFLEVIREYERGDKKYGSWDNLTRKKQTKAVKSECLEWEATNLKDPEIDGRARESEELTHLGNVAGKRWVQLQKEIVRVKT